MLTPPPARGAGAPPRGQVLRIAAPQTVSKDEMVAEVAVRAECRHTVTYTLRDFAGVDLFGITPVRPSDFITFLDER